MYKSLWAYVERELSAHSIQKNPNKAKIRYSRFAHIQRVYRFANRIYGELNESEKQAVDLESLQISAIFHDVGYSREEEDHALTGARLCREFLGAHGYEEEKTEFICGLVARHSDKTFLGDKNSPLELVILQEADLLDDTGAHGIVVDIWMEAVNNPENVSFDSMLEHIKRYTLQIMQENPMRTIPARRLWEEKRALVHEFVRQLELDLQI